MQPHYTALDRAADHVSIPPESALNHSGIGGVKVQVDTARMDQRSHGSLRHQWVGAGAASIFTRSRL